MSSSSGRKVGLELEHTLGFNCGAGLCFHPAQDRNIILYACGRLLVETDLDDCHKQRILRGHDSPITCLDVSPSGAMVGSGQQAAVDGTCYCNIWDYESASVRLRVPTPHKSHMVAVKFSPDDMMVATTGAEGMLCIFDTTSGKCIATYHDSIHGDEARAIRWGTVTESGTRYQRYSLYVPFNTGVRLFSLSFSIQKLSFELQCAACQVPGGGGRLGGYVRRFLCCTTLGQNLLCGTTSGDLMVFNADTGLYRAALSLNANGVSVAATFDDRNCVLVGGGDGKVKKVSGADADWRLYGEVALEGSITAMSRSSDGSQVVVATTAGNIYRMLTDDLTYTIALESPLRGLNDLAVCPTRPEHFLTVSNDGFLRLWTLNDYSIACKFGLGVQPSKTSAGPPPEALIPLCCAFDDNPSAAIVGYSDGRIRCIDVGSGKQGQLVWSTAGGHKGRVHTIRVCKLYILSAGDDSVVRIWSHQTKELVAQLQDHKLPTTSILIDNTTTSIVHSISMDMSHFAYDLSRLGAVQGAPRRVAMHNVAQTGGFLCATQRTDNEHEVIVGTADGRLLFLDFDVSQRPVLEIQDANKTRVCSCQCSPTGEFLATGMGDGSFAVYRLGAQVRGAEKVNTCELAFTTPCHSNAVTKCQWTVDGKQVISSSGDGDLIVWNVYQ